MIISALNFSWLPDVQDLHVIASPQARLWSIPLTRIFQCAMLPHKLCHAVSLKSEACGCKSSYWRIRERTPAKGIPTLRANERISGYRHIIGVNGNGFNYSADGSRGIQAVGRVVRRLPFSTRLVFVLGFAREPGQDELL
jgi:hypothetical protein